MNILLCNILNSNNIFNIKFHLVFAQIQSFVKMQSVGSSISIFLNFWKIVLNTECVEQIFLLKRHWCFIQGQNNICIISSDTQNLVWCMYKTHTQTHTENNNFVHVGNKTKWDKYIICQQSFFIMAALLYYWLCWKLRHLCSSKISSHLR